MKGSRGRLPQVICIWLVLGGLLLVAGVVRAQEKPSTPPAAQPATKPAAPPATFKPEEIEALVAPIALYPDSVLSQVLMASTYPLEIVHAARWVKANPNVKGDAAVKAVREPALGRQREIAGRVPAGARADERQARLDAEARRRLPRAGEGRARRGAAVARDERSSRATSNPPSSRRSSSNRRRRRRARPSRRSCASSRRTRR